LITFLETVGRIELGDRKNYGPSPKGYKESGP
jgi:hypothetical protein